MLRFGLCCLFLEAPVKFRTLNFRHIAALGREERLEKFSIIALENSENLLKALKFAKDMKIGAFRVASDLLPLYTHPETAYRLEHLPECSAIIKNFKEVASIAALNDIRLSFHPDQFVILNSPDGKVVANSIAELAYQAHLASLIGASVINIHMGGVYGDRKSAIARFCDNYKKLPDAIQSRLTLENDDISYTVRDLEPVCSELGIPLVYDVHHHRCNPDGLSVEEASNISMQSWKSSGRGEPYFHISSPLSGWDDLKKRRTHADYINPLDFPAFWMNLDITVDVEAKAKELAVNKLVKDLRGIYGDYQAWGK